MAKIWMDDMRPAPEGYIWVKSVSIAIYEITRRSREVDWAWEQYVLGETDRETLERNLRVFTIEEIACDNDLGTGNVDGYKLLDWLEATGRNYPIRILTSNPVAQERMVQIIRRNHWTMVGGAV